MEWNAILATDPKFLRLESSAFFVIIGFIQRCATLKSDSPRAATLLKIIVRTSSCSDQSSPQIKLFKSLPPALITASTEGLRRKLFTHGCHDEWQPFKMSFKAIRRLRKADAIAEWSHTMKNVIG